MSFRSFVAACWGSVFFLGPFLHSAEAAFDPDGDEPIEIFADDGIEWNEDEKVYIARGAARAIQGDLTVQADILVAHYRIEENGENKIWRLSADGNVRIQDGDSIATAQRGLYDLGQEILVLTGRKVTFTSGRDTVTAKDSLEYWRKKQLAIARGDAVARWEGKVISSDVLSAYLERSEEENRDLVRRIEAFGSVEIVTDSETIRGKKGIYDSQTEIISVIGAVKIIRDKTSLIGDYGEVNLKTGISRLLAALPGEDKKGENKKGKVKARIKLEQ